MSSMQESGSEQGQLMVALGCAVMSTSLSCGRLSGDIQPSDVD